MVTRLRETTQTAEGDLFRHELANIINLRHPLVLLAQKIDWTACEHRFGGLYAAGVGRPGHPIRLMVGAATAQAHEQPVG